MKTKQLVAAAAFTAMLGGGAIAGALIGTPSLSGAVSSQSADPTTTTSTPDSGLANAEDHRGPGFGRDRSASASIEAAATALGVSADDLRTELKDGKTIADVATEKGVDLQRVIDAMVAAETKAIDDRTADIKDNLPERVKDQVNSKFDGTGDHGAMWGRGAKFELDAAADALDLTKEEVFSSLRDGKTLADLAADKGVDVKTLIDAMVKPVNEKIDEAVANDRLTADEAATKKAEALDRITSFVNDGPKFDGSGGPGGFGGDGPPWGQRHR